MRHLLLLWAFFLVAACKQNNSMVNTRQVIIDGNQKFQTIDGFGVNVNPDLWSEGRLKPAFDMLVDDLGATLFRFDCFGRANWLDPLKRQANGTWAQAYLEQVYRSKTFLDAWQAFRYLNSRGIEPYLNVSGVVPQEWNKQGTKVLQDFDAYSEMVCTMVSWARNKENLKFSLLAPYNETDYDGSREGPSIPAENRVSALKAMIAAMERHNLLDLKLTVFCDGYFENAKIENFLNDSSFVKNVTVISGHTYGNGDEGDGGNWYSEKSRLGLVAERIMRSPYRNAHIWLNEYGDLDQTEEIENEFSWRITRRLMKALEDGANSCQYWDAYDNYHKHDSAWTNYGLLKTDTIKGIFTPKKRYFASKQIYRFIKPGYQRVALINPNRTYDVYNEWRNPIKNIKLLAFMSLDGKKLTIIGMSLIESKCYLTFNLRNMIPDTDFILYQTNSTDECKLQGKFSIKNGAITIPLLSRTIFTLTNVKENDYSTSK